MVAPPLFLVESRVSYKYSMHASAVAPADEHIYHDLFNDMFNCELGLEVEC